jgi:Semialdehyde dehydrogenase, NAD binding domain
MKWSAAVLASALTVSSLISVDAFAGAAVRPKGHSAAPAFITGSAKQRRATSDLLYRYRSSSRTFPKVSAAASTSSSTALMSFTVGIVGATGAVGKEIRTCLEARAKEFPVAQLRIFGSSRSAGSKVESDLFGAITVELFDVQAARECDVVFLAVSGEFSLEHARALSAGEDGCVVIDNSVRSSCSFNSRVISG